MLKLYPCLKSLIFHFMGVAEAETINLFLVEINFINHIDTPNYILEKPANDCSITLFYQSFSVIYNLVSKNTHYASIICSILLGTLML